LIKQSFSGAYNQAFVFNLDQRLVMFRRLFAWILVFFVSVVTVFGQVTVDVHFSNESRPSNFYKSVLLSEISTYDLVNLDAVASAGSGFETSGDAKDWVNLSLSFYDIGGNEIDQYDLASFASGSFEGNSLFLSGTEIQHIDNPTNLYISITIPSSAASASLSFYGSVTEFATEYVNLDGRFYASVSAIPEPSTYAAVLGGIALLGYGVRRRFSRKRP